MSTDEALPDRWDESEYSPFPAFVDWIPESYDGSVVDRYERQFASLRTKVSQADLDRALEIVNRYAAVDTGAIEGLYEVDRGFTKTVATQTAAWENALSLKGEGVKRAIDDALGAYEYVLDAVTHAVPITEVWIRQIHQIICASQESYKVLTAVGPQEHQLAKGVYKEMPNSPTSASTGRVHAYAPPALTPAEMTRLVNELRSPRFTSAHPILQAAYAHYAYVAVHPFSDGNGRVARALASVYLYRSPGVPLVVFADQRDRYLDALEAADAGDSGPFVRFVEARTVDAVSLFEASIQADSRIFNADLDNLRAAFDNTDSLEVIVSGADRVKAMARGALNEAFGSMGLPRSVKVLSMDTSAHGPAAPNGWRSVGARERFRVNIDSEYPITVGSTEIFEVLLRTTGVGAEYGIRMDSEIELFEVWLRDVRPSETEALRLRMELWAERSARRMVHTFSEKVRSQVSR